MAICIDFAGITVYVQKTAQRNRFLPGIYCEGSGGIKKRIE